MALVKFARGPRAAYLPETNHFDYVFFCTDESAIYINNVRYGFGEASGIKAIASVEHIDGKAQLLVTYTDGTTATVNLSQVKASNEKIISVDTNGYLQSTLDLIYDNINNKIKLIGISGEIIAQIDTDDFIRDSFLNSAEVVSEKPHPTELDPGATDHGTWLKLTWITSDGQGSTHEVTYVDVSNLVDLYVTETGNDATLIIEPTGGTDPLTGSATKLIRISDVYEAKINAAATDADLRTEITDRIDADAALESSLKGDPNTDNASSLTLEGVKKYADQQIASAQAVADGYDSDLKVSLVGTSGDTSSSNTIYGTKNLAAISDAALKTELIGNSSDTASSIDAKLHADSPSEIIIGSDSLDTAESSGLKKMDLAVAANLAQEIINRETGIAAAKFDLSSSDSSSSGSKRYTDEEVAEALSWVDLP